MKRTVVLKFGGAAVATPEQFGAIADIVHARRSIFGQCVVVVSAMGDMTDRLEALARRIHPDPPERELDMLVSVGERISSSLLAMALARIGQKAVSLTGSQSGIVTSADHADARIVDVRPTRVCAHLAKGESVIVAGFQGVSQDKEITTLGRGGSDTTAVALGIALDAECVEFFKDVRGIYTEDPRHHPQAPLCPYLSYDQALHLVQKADHAVLHPRAIRLASAHALPLKVCSFDHPAQGPGTVIHADAFGETPIAIYETAGID